MFHGSDPLGASVTTGDCTIGSIVGTIGSTLGPSVRLRLWDGDMIGGGVSGTNAQPVGFDMGVPIVGESEGNNGAVSMGLIVASSFGVLDGAGLPVGDCEGL